MNGREKSMTLSIAVVGYGFVGKAVANGFKDIASVEVADNNSELKVHTLDSLLNHTVYDCFFVCVPTPMNIKTGHIDSSIVEKVASNIYNFYTKAEFKQPIIIIKSTTIPSALLRIKDRCPDIRLVMNPEFLVEKTAIEDFENQDRIVLGGEYEDCKYVENLYRLKWKNAKYWIKDLVSASLVKYMNNTFLALKISFIAEWHKLAKAAGVDPYWLVEAFLGDKRVNPSHTKQPGPDGYRGFGGKCLVKDLHALVNYAKQIYDIDFRTLRAAWETNLNVRPERDWEKIKGATSNG